MTAPQAKPGKDEIQPPTPEQIERWKAYMKTCKGHWIVDGVHNGFKDRVLLYRPAKDSSRGVFIDIIGPRITAGTYRNAVPHIGEATFITFWETERESYEEACRVMRASTGADI